MAPGKPYIHKMDASDLMALKDGSRNVVIYWLARKGDSHDSIIFSKYPSKVLATFSDAFGDDPQSADFIAWDKTGVVKAVLQWMLDCCDGSGVKAVKDIDIKLGGLVKAKEDQEFGRYFKTAYLFDFAQEYKIKHLEDKLKRELEFQAKGKYAVRSEEIYDMANYFWQPTRDSTALDLMVDSIAKGIVKKTIVGGRKRAYEEELALWKSESSSECPSEHADHLCEHDDLSEMVDKRVEYFKDPKNAEELNEEFGKSKVAEGMEDADGGDQGHGLDTWQAMGAGCMNSLDDDAGKFDEGDKENQAPDDVNWADDANNAAEGDLWAASATTAAPSGGW